MSNDIIAQMPAIGELAGFYKLDALAFIVTFRKVAMPSPHTDEEFVSCCLVAREHGLNPLTKEIYFMRTKNNGIQPIVSVDGWMKKCNEHPQFDGIEFIDALTDTGEPISCTCIIYRKDRKHQMRVTEYFDECSRAGGSVWKTSPKRMMRHRALTQAARYAFGFAGLMDRDEFDQWQGEPKDITPARPTPLDLPDIPDEPTADDQAAVLRDIEKALQSKPAAKVEKEYATAIMAMDEDGRTNAIEMIEEAKREKSATE